MNKNMRFHIFTPLNSQEQNLVGGVNYTLDNLQSQVVKWLRFPLALFVIYIHYFHSREIIFEDKLGYIINIYTRIFLCHVISHGAVPAFFIISGYYFFFNTEFNSIKYKQKLCKRMKTLFIPYILWNIVALIYNIVDNNKTNVNDIIEFCSNNGWIDIFWSCQEWNGRISWFGVQTTNTAPLLIPMWFIRDLICMVSLTPLIHWMITKFGKWFITLLFVIYISNIWINFPGLSITALFYFSLGSFFAIKKRNMVLEFQKIKKLTFYLIIPFLLIMTYFDGRGTPKGNILYPFFILILVSAYFNAATYMVQHQYLMKFTRWGMASFFIFALHGVCALQLSQKIMFTIMPSDYWALATLRHIIIPIVCAAICYGLFLLMRRFTPQLLDILTGNRR